MLNVRTLALGAMLMVGVAAVAEAQAPSTPPQGGMGRDRGKMGDHRGPGRKAGRGHGDFGRDLNLTEAQKTQIKAIHQKYQPQHKALRERAKPFRDAAIAARQKWDSVGFRTNTVRAQQVMAGGEAIRTQETNEIRALLTAEQRTKFDARQKEMSERRAKMKTEGGRRGMGKRARPAGTAS